MHRAAPLTLLALLSCTAGSWPADRAEGAAPADDHGLDRAPPPPPDLGAETARWEPDGEGQWYVGTVFLGGDFNGDGLDEFGFVTLMRDTDTSFMQEVWYGRSDSRWSRSPDLRFPTGDRLYPTSASAGDVNGDGYDDLLSVSIAPGHNLELRYGAPAGLAEMPDQYIDITGTAGGSIDRDLAGDFNGDGYSDFAFIEYSGDGITVVHVEEGGPGGPDGVADAELSGTGDGPAGYESVHAFGVGDLNGDGYDELAVGYPFLEGEYGRIGIYAGSPTGLADPPEVTIVGPAYQTHLGAIVARAGDLNGDGYGDFAVGLPYWSTSRGGVQVYYGGPTLPTAAGLTLYGESTYDRFGDAVVSAGDTDGDGYDELLIGATYAPAPGDGLYQAGVAELFLGGSSGLDTTPSAVLGPEVDFADFGWSLGGGGDVNGDGRSDVLVASREESPTYTDSYGHYSLYAPDEDADFDGVGSRDDCDDGDPAVGEPTYAAWTDADADTYGDPAAPVVACGPEGTADNELDCDDTRADVHPEAEEQVADGLDQDCDNQELCYIDQDEDGYRSEDEATRATVNIPCDGAGEAASAEPGGDCDDLRVDVHPDAVDLPGNGVDEDCDGADASASSGGDGGGGGAGTDTGGEAAEGGGGKGGCGCASAPGGRGGGAPLLLIGLGLLAATRRRRLVHGRVG